MKDSTVFVVVAVLAIACAVGIVLARDYTSRPPEPVTDAPDASYEQLVAMVCEGVFIPTDEGGCDQIKIVCQYPDGRLVSSSGDCKLRAPLK